MTPAAGSGDHADDTLCQHDGVVRQIVQDEDPNVFDDLDLTPEEICEWERRSAERDRELAWRRAQPDRAFAEWESRHTEQEH